MKLYSKMKKILFLANHRSDRAPGQRFRFEQYLDFLNENGYECELSPLLSEKDDKIFYSKGYIKHCSTPYGISLYGN